MKNVPINFTEYSCSFRVFSTDPLFSLRTGFLFALMSLFRGELPRRDFAAGSIPFDRKWRHESSTAPTPFPNGPENPTGFLPSSPGKSLKRSSSPLVLVETIRALQSQIQALRILVSQLGARIGENCKNSSHPRRRMALQYLPQDRDGALYVRGSARKPSRAGCCNDAGPGTITPLCFQFASVTFPSPIVVPESLVVPFRLPDFCVASQNGFQEDEFPIKTPF